MTRPGVYRPRVSTYWWLHRASYLRFIVRELTSVPVAVFVVITLLQLRALRAGPQAWADFQGWLRQPAVLALNAVCFVAVLYHAITFFNLVPATMVIRLNGKRVPGAVIAASHYVAWLVASAAVAWLILRG